MTILARLALSIVLVLAGSAVSAAAEVVVLKGGTVINLKKSPQVRGSNVLLTRSDGTVLSVPMAEIDKPATAAARAAAPPPPVATPGTALTLVEAARAGREVPKARVRITDADVSHNEASGQTLGDAGAGDAAAAVDASAGAGRVEVAEYIQEKSGDALVVRGNLKNPGATPATNVRMSVTAVDNKGQAIASGEAGLSSAAIEPSSTVAFSVTIPLSGRVVGSIRFTPRWVASAPATPGAPAVAGGAAPSDAAAVSRAPAEGSAAPAPAAPQPTAPPAPQPTPYGRGNLYAPSAPNAPSQAPADGKTGYIPGASHPANQPKPPG